MGKHIGKKLKLISVHLPEGYIDALDRLVEMGLYPSRSEAIRVAIRDLIWKTHRRALMKKYRLVRMTTF